MKYSRIAAITILTALVINAPASSEPVEQRKYLAKRLLELWPVERKAVAIVKSTGSEVVRNASTAIEGRVPADKQQAVMLEVEADVKSYLQDVTPIVETKAVHLKASMLLPFLLEQFSSSELEQLVSMLESPVTQKFERLAPEIQRRYEQRVIEDSGEEVNHRLAQLSESVNQKLTAAVTSK